MKEIVKYIVNHIVENPDAVKITEDIQDGGNNITITISVDQSDMGKIIGKQGKTIKAIRTITKILAIKQQKYVDVIIDNK